MLLLKGAASAAEPVRLGELQRDTLKGAAASGLASTVYIYLALAFTPPDPSLALETVPYFLVKYCLCGILVFSVTFLGSITIMPARGLWPFLHKHTWRELPGVEWPNDWVVTKHRRGTVVTRPNEYYVKCEQCTCKRWVSWAGLHGIRIVNDWDEL